MEPWKFSTRIVSPGSISSAAQIVVILWADDRRVLQLNGPVVRFILKWFEIR